MRFTSLAVELVAWHDVAVVRATTLTARDLENEPVDVDLFLFTIVRQLAL